MTMSKTLVSALPKDQRSRSRPASDNAGSSISSVSHVLHFDAVEGLPPLPTAPGETSKIPPSTFAASTGPSRPLPSRPPYKVFIGNVPFDATEDDMGMIFYPELAVRMSLIPVTSRLSSKSMK